jgi:hypothetical protein
MDRKLKLLAESLAPRAREELKRESESYTTEELNEAFAQAGYDTKKYTTEYLAEQLGFVPLSEMGMKDARAFKNEKLFLTGADGQYGQEGGTNKFAKMASVLKNERFPMEGIYKQVGPIGSLFVKGLGKKIMKQRDKDQTKYSNDFSYGSRIVHGRKLGKDADGNVDGGYKQFRKRVEALKLMPDGSYTPGELEEAFKSAGLDTGKYTTEYLAEQLGFKRLK